MNIENIESRTQSQADFCPCVLHVLNNQSVIPQAAACVVNRLLP